MSKGKGNSKNKARNSSAHRPVLEFLTFALALLGILVVVHLWIQNGRGFDRGCFGFSDPAVIAAAAGCEAVIESDAGTFLGISNVFLGFGFYLALAVLSFLAIFRNGTKLRQIKSLQMLMIGVGVLYSSYLFYVQVSEQAFCKLCLMSATIVLLLFIVQLVGYFTKPTPGDPAVDKASLIRKMPFLGALIAGTIVLAGADVAYFNGLGEYEGDGSEVAVSGTTTAASGAEAGAAGAAVVGECKFDRTKPVVENFADMTSFSDPSKGDPNSSVVVMEFFDPNCPHCKTAHPIFEKVAADYADKARFVYRPFVLSRQSFMQVESLHIAAQEGKFFEMMEAQFDRQRRGALTLDDMRQIAEEIGLDFDLLKHRLDNQMFRSIMIRQRNVASEAGVGVVPTIMINGRFVESNSRSVDCLKELIDQVGSEQG